MLNDVVSEIDRYLSDYEEEYMITASRFKVLEAMDALRRKLDVALPE